MPICNKKNRNSRKDYCTKFKSENALENAIYDYEDFIQANPFARPSMRGFARFAGITTQTILQYRKKGLYLDKLTTLEYMLEAKLIDIHSNGLLDGRTFENVMRWIVRREIEYERALEQEKQIIVRFYNGWEVEVIVQ